jgi:hypothetical protein
VLVCWRADLDDKPTAHNPEEKHKLPCFTFSSDKHEVQAHQDPPVTLLHVFDYGLSLLLELCTLSLLTDDQILLSCKAVDLLLLLFLTVNASENNQKIDACQIVEKVYSKEPWQCIT